MQNAISLAIGMAFFLVGNVEAKGISLVLPLSQPYKWLLSTFGFQLKLYKDLFIG
jgi:hypothetical protein